MEHDDRRTKFSDDHNPACYHPKVQSGDEWQQHVVSCTQRAMSGTSELTVSQDANNSDTHSHKLIYAKGLHIYTEQSIEFHPSLCSTDSVDYLTFVILF